MPKIAQKYDNSKIIEIKYANCIHFINLSKKSEFKNFSIDQKLPKIWIKLRNWKKTRNYCKICTNTRS